MELTGLRTIDDLSFESKTVFVRVDFNVPLQDGVITDDARIRAALPTIQKLREAGAKIVLGSHLGRPKGAPKPALSMVPVASRLAELLGIDVVCSEDCVGDGVRKLVRDLKSGDVLMLENLRFHAAETACDPLFSKELASLADVYVNDAFGTSHRKHASTYGMVRHFADNARGAGYLIGKELTFLDPLLRNPRKPYVAIMGGAKVSDKIKVIESLLGRVNTLLIGGAMAYTFLASRNIEVGRSLVERDKISLARQLLERAGRANTEIILPLDHGIAPSLESDERVDTHDASIPATMVGLDIGPRTIERYKEVIADAATIIWNGPLGMFEREPFHRGTFAIANAVADNASATTVIGGGDSAAAIEAAGRRNDVDHVSTGGGASLEFLEGADLPGIAALRAGHRFD